MVHRLDYLRLVGMCSESAVECHPQALRPRSLTIDWKTESSGGASYPISTCLVQLPSTGGQSTRFQLAAFDKWLETLVLQCFPMA